MTRNFQLAAMVVLVAVLVGTYIDSRGHRPIDDPAPVSAPDAVVPSATPDAKPLPSSRADILADLQRHGLTLEEASMSTYRVKGAPLGIGFTEHDGKLLSVEAMALAGMAERNLTELRGWAATVGEVSTGLPRGGVLQVVDLLLADVGSSPRGFSRTVDDGQRRIKIDVTRHDDGAYSFVFAAE